MSDLLTVHCEGSGEPPLYHEDWKQLGTCPDCFEVVPVTYARLDVHSRTIDGEGLT